MFNLSKNNVAQMAEAGYELELIVPGTDEGTGGFINVRGVEAKVSRQFARKMVQEQMKKEAAQKGKQKATIDFDHIDDSMARTALSRIISWRGISVDGENELEFNETNALMVLKEHPWISDQILEASNDLENFRT